MSLAICAIFKDEALYLREWIEFHRIVGVEKFYLYENSSSDDWKSVVRPYIGTGVVEIVNWPAAPPCQLAAYQHFINSHKGLRGWTAFMDCDEFLFSPRYPTVVEALNRAPSPYGAVAAHWMCFGAGGHERRSDGPVIERFISRTSAAFPPNRHVKTIARTERLESVAADPHYFRVVGGTCNESGRPLTGPLSVPPTHAILRINHYITKSREEFLTRIGRGRADLPTRRAASDFDGYQAADETDRAIWRFLPELKRRLARDATAGHSGRRCAP